eukprot:m.341956 g.341956  ORF g.341956 m.341956 type:complete len:811 (-) comp27844_c0_seq4:818-3250(-)
MAMRSAYGQSQSGVEAVAVIERLKQRLKDDDVSPTDSTVAELRHAAQELLADTLMGDIQSASSGLLDKHLWQHGFYNHMVLFRQRLKRFDAEAAKGSASAVSELAATRLGLKSFLHAGIGFYTALIHGVCERYRLVLPGLAVGGLLGVQSTSLGGNHGQASAVDQRYATATCQRALLYLGDLSRYLQLYCVSNPRWSGVKGYYTQALAVLPQSGSPHGQLAIVASLERANVDAAYHYSRAALAESPSAPATENLVRMYAKLLKEGRNKVDVELPGGQRERRGLHHACLQGVIMVHAQILSGSKSVSLTFDNDRASTVAALGEVVRQQSTHAGLPCGTLQKLFCVFVFSLHHAAGRERGGSRSKRAVVFMLDFFSCMLGCARAALAQGVSNGGEEETPNDGRDDALATAKLIADWLQSSVWCWCGSPDVTEGAPAHVHRHGAWSALATLLNSAASAVGHGALLGDEVDETARPSLPEDVLLAGFSPASPATTTATTPTSIGADAAVVTRAGLNEQRLQRLFAFGEFLADTLGDKPEDRVLTSERDDLLRSGRRFSASHRADANPLVGVDSSDGAMAGEKANLVAGAATIIGAAVLPTSEPTHDAFGHPLPSALDSYSDDEHAPDLPDWLTEGDTFGAAAIAFSSLDLGPPGRNATSDADAMDSLWGGQSLLGADLVSNINGQMPEGGGGGFIGAPPPLLQSNGGGGGGGGRFDRRDNDRGRRDRFDGDRRGNGPRRNDGPRRESGPRPDVDEPRRDSGRRDDRPDQRGDRKSPARDAAPRSPRKESSGDGRSPPSKASVPSPKAQSSPKEE